VQQHQQLERGFSSRPAACAEGATKQRWRVLPAEGVALWVKCVWRGVQQACRLAENAADCAQQWLCLEAFEAAACGCQAVGGGSVPVFWGGSVPVFWGVLQGRCSKLHWRGFQV
jgi:hypothetical protein